MVAWDTASDTVSDGACLEYSLVEKNNRWESVSGASSV